MTSEIIKILLIEDSDEDAQIFTRLIRSIHSASTPGSYEIEHAATLEAGIARHQDPSRPGIDIIFLDLNLPGSTGVTTIRSIIPKIRSIPIVVVTTSAGGDLGTLAIKLGAQDYVEKCGLNSIALRRVIHYSIERFKLLQEKNLLIAQLSEAREIILELRKIIPICSYCKKIRNDDGYWEQLESYIHKHMDALLSHGICPDCVKTLGL